MPRPANGFGDLNRSSSRSGCGAQSYKGASTGCRSVTPLVTGVGVTVIAGVFVGVDPHVMVMLVDVDGIDATTRRRTREYPSRSPGRLRSSPTAQAPIDGGGSWMTRRPRAVRGGRGRPSSPVSTPLRQFSQNL